jgi:hypothetical protein
MPEIDVEAMGGGGIQRGVLAKMLPFFPYQSRCGSEKTSSLFNLSY